MQSTEGSLSHLFKIGKTDFFENEEYENTTGLISKFDVFSNNNTFTDSKEDNNIMNKEKVKERQNVLRIYDDNDCVLRCKQNVRKRCGMCTNRDYEIFYRICEKNITCKVRLSSVAKKLKTKKKVNHFWWV